jgi:hypothetical protein
MHSIERRCVEKFAADAGLIRGNSHRETRAGQFRNRVDTAVDRQKLRGRLYEFVRVMIDHAIAIEDYKPPRQSLLLSGRQPGYISNIQEKRPQLRQQRKPVLP